MSDELDSLASAAADVLVRAIASDGWDAAKSLYTRMTRGREHQVERTREALGQGEGTARVEATDREKANWRTRLRDAMDDDPALVAEIKRVLAAQSPAASAGTVSQSSSRTTGPVQQAAASGGSNITQVEVSGGRNIRVNSPDQRRYRFTVPFVPLFLRKVIVEHAVVSVIALVAVSGATVGIVAAARSSHDDSPAVWSSFSTVTAPSGASLSVPTFAPSGTTLAALDVTTDGAVQAVAVDLAKGDAIQPIDTSDDIQSVADIQEFSFDPSGGLLASVIDTGQDVALLNTSNWNTVRTISNPGPSNRWLTVEYSPTGA